MADTPLAKKLLIKAGQRVAIINAPDGYMATLGALPDGVKVSKALDGSYDCVHVFVRDRADLERLAHSALNAVKPGALLWLSFPKKSSKIKTDISRDTGWDTVTAAGWEGVSLISIDEVWSAMRFKRVH